MLARAVYNKSRNFTGFSLIEVLVVLVIIGVVVAAITLTMKNSGSSQQVKSAVNILRARMLLAEQQAVIKSSTIGLAIGQDGYQFYQLEVKPKQASEQWVVITDHDGLAYQAWPKRLDLTLDLPAAPNTLIPFNLPKQPMMVFNASGSVTPFTLTIDAYRIVGKQNGAISIHEK